MFSLIMKKSKKEKKREGFLLIRSLALIRKNFSGEKIVKAPVIELSSESESEASLSEQEESEVSDDEYKSLSESEGSVTNNQVASSSEDEIEILEFDQESLTEKRKKIEHSEGESEEQKEEVGVEVKVLPNKRVVEKKKKKDSRSRGTQNRSSEKVEQPKIQHWWDDILGENYEREQLELSGKLVVAMSIIDLTLERKEKVIAKKKKRISSKH